MRHFWAKTGAAVDGRPDWHPCLFHALDVAAVGQAMLERQPVLLERICGTLGLPEDAVRALVLQWLLLHDVGKLSRPFQAMSRPHWPAALGPWPVDLPAEPRHAPMGHFVMTKLFRSGDLAAVADWDDEVFEALVAPFLGHHGRPVRLLASAVREHRVLDAVCRRAVRDLAALAGSLFPCPPLDQPALDAARIAAWQIAGLVVLADWLGSNARWFPFTRSDTPLHTYWCDARSKAADAVRDAGMVPAATSRIGGFVALTGTGFPPTAMQRWAESVALDAAPTIAVIEDVTGSGKTEAAIVLAHRLMQAGQGDGIYVALPTMATANAMFERMGRIHRRLFEPGADPSLALAHAARRLHEGFCEGLRAARGMAAPGEEDDAAADGDGNAAACNAWIGDSTRKTFLAQVGIGTIDQALLSVLPARYQSLRLYGLCRRVLIVDEAHAYDDYMRAELQRLVTFQAALGGSVIILSATLPRAMRRALLGAFAEGRGLSPPLPQDHAYPLASLWARDRLVEAPQPARTDLCRTLAIERLASSDEAADRITAAAQDGRAVAWVRNTVDDVLEADALLRARGVAVEVFHARFALADRMAIERAVVARFGRDGAADERRGRVLVATQVIEQSLDLDFDLMVSDLAPIDLLLQRAGRVCRHARGPRPGPRLLVVSPDPAATIEEDWFSASFPGAGAVYGDHALLWRSARKLFEKAQWRIPEEVRAMIEAVYEPNDDPPPALQRSASDAEGSARAAVSLARTNLLELRAGYDGQPTAPWDADVRVPTRLGEERRVLRLARLDGTTILPWHPDRDPARAWALSEVNVRRSRHWPEADLVPDGHAAAAARAKATWTRFDADKLLVVLQPSSGLDDAVPVVVESGSAAGVAYDPRLGLLREKHNP